MLLAVDVGNTHSVIGTYQGDRLERHWRLRTDNERTADEYGVLLLGLFGTLAGPVRRQRDDQRAGSSDRLFGHEGTVSNRLVPSDRWTWPSD